MNANVLVVSFVFQLFSFLFIRSFDLLLVFYVLMDSSVLIHKYIEYYTVNQKTHLLSYLPKTMSILMKFGIRCLE